MIAETVFKDDFAFLGMIWAQGNSRAIGIKDGLPWQFKADMQRFVKITKHIPTGFSDMNTIIYGYNTWKSFGFKPLPGRRNIIISDEMPMGYFQSHTHFVSSVEEAVSLSKHFPGSAMFVIGGAYTYDQFKDYATHLYVTDIDIEVEYDTQMSFCYRDLLIKPNPQFRLDLASYFCDIDKNTGKTHNMAFFDLKRVF